MKSFNDIREKTLTPAELKKREEIAKAMKQELVSLLVLPIRNQKTSVTKMVK